MRAIGTFIALSLQPVNIVDKLSFRMLLSEADPRFGLPHRTHFATKVMLQMYVSVWDRIEKQLREVDHCTITTDLWTSSHQRSHFVDINFTLKKLCLKTLEVFHRNIPGESIKKVLLSMFNDWNISDKVFGGTTDDGQNNYCQCYLAFRIAAFSLPGTHLTL